VRLRQLDACLASRTVHLRSDTSITSTLAQGVHSTRSVADKDDGGAATSAMTHWAATATAAAESGVFLGALQQALAAAAAAASERDVDGSGSCDDDHQSDGGGTLRAIGATPLFTSLSAAVSASEGGKAAADALAQAVHTLERCEVICSRALHCEWLVG
jgi:hypothetical protein